MEDLFNMLVLGIAMFVGGMAFHSTLAHYLPDDWRFIKWLKTLLGG